MYEAFLDALKARSATPTPEDWYPFGGEIEDDGFITVYVSPPLKQD